MNFQKIASKIALQEGKKHQASVGDVREILKLTFTELANMNVLELAEILRRYKKRS